MPTKTQGGIDMLNPFYDEYGHHMGYCNSCGEEAEMGSECCEDGEVVVYDDDPNPHD